MKNQLATIVPDFLKPALRKIYYLPADCINSLKRQDSMIPPRSMRFVGRGDFEKIGQDFKGYFVELAGLQPNHRVLDVGCGIGRMAIPLTDYLSEEGKYWGFDIVKEGIEWCESRISTRFSNFNFQHSDVFNKHYNPSGTVEAKDFHFPYEDNSFDFIFLTSVFTHMFPADLENYLDEISRTLRTGGKCFITFFLLNEESEKLIVAGKSTLDFKRRIEGCLTASEKDPEYAIAYDEDRIFRLFEKCGLKIAKPIRYGSWCKRSDFLSYQDIVIAEK